MRIEPTKLFFLLLILLTVSVCVAPVSADAADRIGDPLTLTHVDTEYHLASGGFNPATDSVFADFINLRVMVNLNDFFSLNNPTTGLYNTTPENSKAVYSVNSGKAVTGSPAVLDGCIYYGTSAGVVCYDISTKTEKWTYSDCGAVYSGITAADGKIYFGNAAGELCSLSADGTDFRKTTAIDTVAGIGLTSTPLLKNGIVYVTTQTPAYLKGYSTADFSETVNISLTSGVAAFSSPSAQEEIIYTSGLGGIASYAGGENAVLIKETDGETGTPVCHDSWIYAATASTLYGINPSDDTQSWSVPNEGFASTPVVTDDYVVLNSKTGLTAYDAKTGTVKWTHDAAASANAMFSVPYAVDKELPEYGLHDVAPVSPVLAGDIVFYAANFGDSEASGRTILFGVNLADGRDYVPAADSVDKRKIRSDGTITASSFYYYFSQKYAEQQEGVLIKTAGTEYLIPNSNGLYQIYVSQSESSLGYSESDEKFIVSPATSDNVILAKETAIRTTLTADGKITGGRTVNSGNDAKVVIIYDRVYPYHAVIENSWITTASPAASGGYLIAGYDSGDSGSLILHGMQSVPLYIGTLSMQPSISTTDLDVADATPLGILEQLKKNGNILGYTTDGTALTGITAKSIKDEIACTADKKWSVTINGNPSELTTEIEKGSSVIRFAYGSGGESEYYISVTASVATKQLGFAGISVPDTLTIGDTGIRYNTPYGVLTLLSKDEKLTFTIENLQVTEVNGITNSGTNIWYLTNDQSIDTELSISNPAELLYGPVGERTKAALQVHLIVPSTIPFAEFSLDDVYSRQINDKSESTLKPIITDWNGNKITASAGEITWTWTNSDDFAYTVNDDGTLTYRPVTGKESGETVITAEYRPAKIGSDAVPAGTVLSAESNRIKIIGETFDPIPENPEIETTIHYTTSHGNFARTGFVNDYGPETPTILWDINFLEIGSGYIPLVDGDPIVYNGSVYFSIWGSSGMTDTGGTLKSVDGLYSVNSSTGNINWYISELPSRGGLAINNGVLYGGTTESSSGAGRLFAVNPDTGEVNWKTDVIAGYAYTGLAAAPLVYDDIIYVVTRQASNEIIKSSLVAFKDEGTTYTKVSELSLTPAEGSAVAEKFSTASVSPDGTIYVPAYGGVAAVNSTDLSVKWVYDTGARGPKAQGGNNQFVGTPVYKDQHVYFVSTGTLWCLDAVTGNLVWSQSYETMNAGGAPVVTDKYIVISGGVSISDGGDGCGISIYDLDGQLLHRTLGGGDIGYTSPLVAGDIAYYGSYGAGTIYAVNISTGKEVWHYKLPNVPGKGDGWYNIIEAVPAIENGILYVGSENGHFYAFKSPSLEDIEITAPQNITAGVPAVFTGAAPAGASYTWTFGDESTAAGQTVSKTWNTAGSYTVKLKAVVNGQSGTAEKTITVEAAPAAITTPVSPEVAAPAGLADEQKPALLFDETDKDESAAEIKITISDYQTDETGAVNLGAITAPPETAKSVLKIVLDADGLKDEHKLAAAAKLTVNISISDEDKNNLSFWRYPDALAAGQLPQLLAFSENTTVTVPAPWHRFDITVPGFSTILGTVSTGTLPAAAKDGTTDPDTPAQPGKFNYIPINPGTGSFKYTTNHPDWPAVTFTIDRMTAFGVLYASHANIVTAERWGGVYVHSINGLAPTSDTEGWMYQVNGYAPGAMANNCPVSIGDEVVWYYSEDMTKPVSQSKQIYAFTVEGIPPLPVDPATGAVILPMDEFFLEDTQDITKDAAVYNTTRTTTITQVTLPANITADTASAYMQVIEGNRIDLVLPVNVSSTDVNTIFEISVLGTDRKELHVNESGNFTFKCVVGNGKKLLVGHKNQTAGVWENCTVTSAGEDLWTAEYDSLSTFGIFVVDEKAVIPLVEKQQTAAVEPTAEPTPEITQTIIPTTKPTPLPTASRTEVPVKTPAPLAGILLGAIGAAVLLRRRA